jgi:hypothetical protein
VLRRSFKIEPKNHRKMPSLAMTERSFTINKLPCMIYGASYSKSESHDDTNITNK